MMYSPSPADPSLFKTPLHGLHERHGARFMPFAGFDMPQSYRGDAVEEHLHTRAKAGLFDVSHKAQIRLEGADADAVLERLTPGDIKGLELDRSGYALLTNETGGIREELMVTRRADHLFLVANTASEPCDTRYLKSSFAGTGVDVVPLADCALLALQGPDAAKILSTLAPMAGAMPFMSAAELHLAGADCLVTRSGYTGEDGFEISVPAAHATRLAKALLDLPGVALIGMAARDTLRLEAGFCLYGQDIDNAITPVEAGLAGLVAKRRRAEGGFPGHAVIMQQLNRGPLCKRVGLKLASRIQAGEGAEIMLGERHVGIVTSGGFAPSIGGPIAMGYVETALAKPGSGVELMVQGKPLPAIVTPLPFVPHHDHLS